VRFDPAIHRRRSIRLRDFDYSQAGAYFVTLCVHDRVCLLGEIVDEAMRLNDAGRMVHAVWNAIPFHYPGVDIDAFIAMPNHIHAIIVLVGAGPRACPVTGGQPRGVAPTGSEIGQPRGVAPTGSEIGQPRGVAPTLSLPDVVHRFKTMTTKRYVDGVERCAWPRFNGKLWQRNYYEHIIRNDADLNRIRAYIENNPARWAQDSLHPASHISAT